MSKGMGKSDIFKEYATKQKKLRAEEAGPTETKTASRAEVEAQKQAAIEARKKKESYLAKYMDGGDGEKKKKRKKPKLAGPALKIIDEDFDWRNTGTEVKLMGLDGLGLEDGEGPVIVNEEEMKLQLAMERGEAHREQADDWEAQYGVIRKKYDDGSGWAEVGPGQKARRRLDSDDEAAGNGSDKDNSPPRRKRLDSPPPGMMAPSGSSASSRGRARADEGEDNSPPRGRLREDGDSSPPRRRLKEDGDEDSSPPRRRLRGEGDDNSPPPRRLKEDGDSSPPRRRKDNAEDNSPPRHVKDGKNSSPPRQRRLTEGNKHNKQQSDDKDSSPPRRRVPQENDKDSSPPRRKRLPDEDQSPPRTKRLQAGRDEDSSPPRKHSSSKLSTSNRDSRAGADVSSPRGKRDKQGDDLSPPRRKKDSTIVKVEGDSSSRRRSKADEDLSPPRPSSRAKQDEDLSPPRRGSNVKYEEKQRESKSKLGAEGDLSPPRRGLRTKEEFAQQHEVEYEKKMATLRALGATNGAGAATVIRDENGRRLTPEEVEERKKALEEKEKDKPMEWGKGLVQRRAVVQRVLAEQEENNFARGKDDFRMNEMLKQQERWGDPMLEQVKKSQKIRDEKEQLRSKAPRKLSRPMYRGDPWPNRFGIRPGHRWDGVDRSNGWEAKIVLAFAEAKVRSEQGYKWGTADM